MSNPNPTTSNVLTPPASAGPNAPTSSTITRSEAITVGALVMVAYAALGFLHPYAAGTLADDGVYLTVGKALAQGEGYRNIHLVGAPPNTNYPPGMPLLFALVWQLAGELNTVRVIAAWLNLAVCGVAAGLLWSVARSSLQLTRVVAACFVIAPLLLDISFHHYKLALSEPYFLLGWAALLWLYYRVRDAQHTRQLLLAALLGVAALAVVCFRLQAVGLIPAVLVALLIERRRFAVVGAYLLGVFTPILLATLIIGPGDVLAQIRSAPHFAWLATGGVSEFLRFAWRAMTDNFFIYVLRLVHHTAAVPAMGYTLVALNTLLVVAGFLFLLRRHPAPALTLLATLVIVLIWPFNDGRLIAVMLPFAGMVAAAGVDLLVRSGGGRARWILAAAACLVALPVVARQIEFYRDTHAATPRTQRSFTLGYALRRNSELINTTANWVRQHTRPDDRVMVAQTAGVFLQTGRKAVESNPPQSSLSGVGPAPFATPGRYLASVILSEQVTVLALEHRGLRVERDADVVQRACPGVLQRMDAAADTAYPAYYRVVRNEPCLRQLLDSVESEM